MPAETVLAVLAAAAKTGILEAITKKIAGGGTDAILEMVENLIEGHGGALTKTERSRVEQLLDEDERLLRRLTAQMKPADRTGILVVGPSGAGKTSIINAITNRVHEDEPTVSIDKYFVQLGGSIVAVRDVPGTVEHGATVWPAVQKYRPKIVVIVLADGYLDSVGTGNELKRPRRPAVADLETYLTNARQEEIEWLEVFAEAVAPARKRTPYLVLLLNKMDLWADRHPDVLKRYQGDEFMTRIRNIEKKLLQPGRICQVTTVAAGYDGFKGRVSPRPEVNRKVCNQSIKLLKAFLAGLMVDGNL